jgi:hypothetical protein
MEETRERIVEAKGEAQGDAQAQAGFTIIVEATGRATGSAMNALRQMHSALNDIDER